VETQVNRAGGIMPSRTGGRVAARAVGLADRSDLGVLTMTGAAASLSELVGHTTGTSLAVGGVVASADTWWCRASAGEVVTVTEPPARARILTTLRMPTARLHGLDVRDASAEMAAIAVVGRRAADVLAALGLLGSAGDPRAVAPFTSQTLAGAPVRLLLQTDRRALVLAPTAEAERVWEAIQTAGRPFGLSLVGTDALRLLALQERVATAQSGGLRHT
jgi:glycine cleavage system aminomethyltransferase T